MALLSNTSIIKSASLYPSQVFNIVYENSLSERILSATFSSGVK
jgi:hypothetical protein